MKSLILALMLTMNAQAQPGSYQAAVAAAKDAGVSAPALRSAIARALLDWTGGGKPGYAASKDADRRLLAAAKVTVTPLPPGKKREAFRRKLNATRADRRRALLLAYEDRLAASASPWPRELKSGLSPTPPDKKAAYEAQAARMGPLTAALKALSTAKNEVQFADSLAAFNAAAAKFGKGYELTRREGESYAEVVERARNVYATEAATLASLRSGSSTGAGDGIADIETLKATGSFFDGGNGTRVPLPGSTVQGGGTKTKDPASTAANGGGGKKPSSKTKAPPSPESEKKAPGIARMAGSLFMGLFRTAGRVCVALASGFVGVGKAMMS